MTQYRKKPVTIEAIQFNGLNPTEIKDFVGEKCEVEIYDNKVTPPIANIIIHTLEGDMEVSKGDYVIRGIKGEFYPCKPDIFEQTYESAEIQQEPMEVDLDKEIKSWIQNHVKGDDFEPYRTIKKKVIEWGEFVAHHFYKIGKKDMKKQMMKEAVEGEAHVGYPFSKPFIDIEQSSAQWCNIMKKFMNGDKVKVIVIKKEENK